MPFCTFCHSVAQFCKNLFNICSWCENCIENTKCGYCYNDFGNGAVNGSCLHIEGDDGTHSSG